MAPHPGIDDPSKAAREAAAALLATTGGEPFDVTVVLGSGWAPAADALAARGSTAGTVAMADLPHFAPPSAAGHSGTAIALVVGAKRVLVLLGRTHAYEGHDLSRVVHPVRTACAAGASTVILTNAAGGLREGMHVGEAVLISDHLNLTARSPLVGAQFVNLVDAYSPRCGRSRGRWTRP
ncbi:hypothetical protein MTP03_37310 [Tsukamurella sp. PLM1]|nr:hypothetical protein MTP03_37310 [Tsukamurella sp. PLM1]